MTPVFICSIVVTRSFFDFVSPPMKSEMYQVDSQAACYALAAEKWTAGKSMFTVGDESEWVRFCGPDHSGCPKWPSSKDGSRAK
jgi:hypothetical protein